MFFKIKSDVFFGVQLLAAYWTICSLSQPVFNAIRVEDMEATEHPAVSLVAYRINANNTLIDHVFPVFHSNQNLLQLVILLLRKAFVDR